MKEISKSKLFWIFITIGVVILLAISLFGKSKTVQIGEIKSFSFSYTCGTTANANVQYTLEQKDGGYIASVKPKDEPQEAVKTFFVDEDFARELEKLFIQYDVGKWNGFDKTDTMLMDGDCFSFSMTMTNDTLLSAHGYMKWPKNYSSVKDGIEAIFSNR